MSTGGKGRAWGLTATVLLHMAAALILLQGLAPGAQPGQPRASSIRMNLLAARPEPRPATAPMPALLAPEPAAPARPTPTPGPANAAIAAAALSTLASAAEPIAQAAPAEPRATVAAPTPAPASAREPEYRAATPPDRACADRYVARHYPQMLRERGIEGQVLLRVRVDERGQAAEVLVQGGSGWRLLDEAAQVLARGCPYVPARRGDQTLASWVEYPVRFALQATQ